MKTGVLSFIFALAVANSLFAQYDSDPCNMRDTLDRLVLQAHDYNRPGWYDKRGKIYLLIEYERDLNNEDDSVVAEFTDIGLKVSTVFIQGDIFEGLSFTRKTDTGWTEFEIQINTNKSVTYSISRPDPVKQPYILQLIYSEGFNATRGGDDGLVMEIWDVLNHTRLAGVNLEYGTYHSSTAVDGSYEEGGSFDMRRTGSFDGKTLKLGETTGTRRTFYQSRVEGEDQREKIMEKPISCGPREYELIDGYFILKKQ